MHLLSVKVDRLTKWYTDGLICIGESAHAMSPIGGIGINLAIQDAVATVNILWKPLLEKKHTTTDLKKVQNRREQPTKLTQGLQVFIQNNAITPLLKYSRPIKAPQLLKLFNIFPLLQSNPARKIGIGFRPEHIQQPLKPQ